jgi:hypothetical protein
MIVILNFHYPFFKTSIAQSESDNSCRFSGSTIISGTIVVTYTEMFYPGRPEVPYERNCTNRSDYSGVHCYGTGQHCCQGGCFGSYKTYCDDGFDKIEYFSRNSGC